MTASLRGPGTKKPVICLGPNYCPFNTGIVASMLSGRVGRIIKPLALIYCLLVVFIHSYQTLSFGGVVQLKENSRKFVV